jgi:PA14 domain/Secretion system C-terminal sorting domain
MNEFYENNLSVIAMGKDISQFVKHFTGNRKLNKRLIAFFCVLTTFMFFSLSGKAQTYDGPIVITEGGTYSGNWESTDPNVPAVDIRTEEPVIIEYSNVRHAGVGINSLGLKVNLTVRYTSGYGFIAPITKDKERRFVNVGTFKNVVVENCYMEGGAGILVADNYYGNSTELETVKIRYNKAKNIDGRIYGAQKIAQFVQFNFRGAIKYAEIAWNEVINEPDASAVEDNININDTRGTVDSPIKIHDNYIQGAYPIPANGPSYTGGGIITEGSDQSTSSTSTAYVEAYNNHLVNLGNYSMGISGANNVKYYSNHSVNSALFDDGSKFNMYSSGMWSKDSHNRNTTFNNIFDGNTIGVMNRQYNDQYPSVRKDFADTIGVVISNTIHLPDPITKQTEQDEFANWQQKLVANNIKLGPIGSEPTPEIPEGTGTGTIVLERWDNVTTESIADIPFSSTPSSTLELTLFEAPSNVGDNYGQRIRGYVTAPVSGDYYFWIASDNHGELWLSGSEDPGQAQKIAYVNGFAGPQEWDKFTTQKSGAISLEAGKRYYIEARHVEGLGGDNLAVGWQLPGGAYERPIAGNRLSPYSSSNFTATSGAAAKAIGVENLNDRAIVFPNPFTADLTLHLGASEAGVEGVTLLNQIGQVVYQESQPKINGNQLTIDTKGLNLKAGLYILRYTDRQGKQQSLKVLKR